MGGSMKSIIKSMTVVLLCIVVCAAIPATSTLGKAENVIEHINEHRQDKTRQDKTRQLSCPNVDHNRHC